MLKLSGEALASSASDEVVDANVLDQLATEIVAAKAILGVEITIVVGGGNIWRGTTGVGATLERATSDHMGMLATVINALALQSAIERKGQAVRVQSAIQMAELAELDGGSVELAHDVAVHIGFAKPKYLSRDEVPADVVESERATLEAISRNEGKPEAALPKIIEGRLNGFFRQICLNEQDYAKDEKKSVSQVLEGHKIVRFSQVIVGA